MPTPLTPTSIEPHVRKAALGFQPYVAGRPISAVKRELGLKEVVKLASNENPLGPSPKALAALKKAASEFHRYPDSASFDLRRAIAKRWGVRETQVILGCGSDEIIELLGKLLLNPQDNVVVSEHAFVRYAMAALLMGSQVITVPMRNLTHDLEAMARAVTLSTKIVFIANPNNPTGTYNATSEVDKFLANIPERVLVVFDEAYYEYARVKKNYPETLSAVKAGANVIVLRTFSKVYGLAGLRVGYGIGPENLVDYLDRIRPPFNVNSAAQAAALAALQDQAHLTKSVKLVERQKQMLEKELASLPVEVVPSCANFFLIKVPGTGRSCFEALLKKGVIVRAMEEYGFPEYVRVTIGTEPENKKFLKAFKEVITRGK